MNINHAKKEINFKFKMHYVHSLYYKKNEEKKKVRG